MSDNSSRATQQRGFTIVQMMITLAVVAVVTTFGVLGIRTARAEFRVHSAARLFASYIEKARVDAIRRHAPDGEESSIETFAAATRGYAVTMDFGSGIVETRTFELDSGLSFHTDAKKVSFDWRGRILEGWVFQIHSDYLDDNVPVDVSGSGDITVGSQHFPDQSIPDVVIAEVTGDVDSDPAPSPSASAQPSPDPGASPQPTPSPSPSATANGNGNGGNGNDGNNGNNGNGNPSPTPTPQPTPSANPSPGATPVPTPVPPCVSSISPSTLSLSQSDVTKQTGTATFTMANASGVRIISAKQAGNGNSLVIAMSLLRIDGSGSSVVSITTKHGAGNRGVFVVQVSGDPACGSAQQLTVSVSN
jgi:hypothetical protein